MDCYFGAYPLPEHNEIGKSSLVLFSIPEIGIRFKAPFAGEDINHSDFASLLALLEFIDSNQKYFTNKTFQIHGNNLTLINQLNGREAVPHRYTPLIEKAVAYRKKYHFSLDWVPARENSAYDTLIE
ncbi:MAG: hypothetical protein AB1644_07285 [Candidatus Zixiibacteriota bacterium]